jgi:hypothetical protein
MQSSRDRFDSDRFRPSKPSVAVPGEREGCRASMHSRTSASPSCRLEVPLIRRECAARPVTARTCSRAGAATRSRRDSPRARGKHRAPQPRRTACRLAPQRGFECPASFTWRTDRDDSKGAHPWDHPSSGVGGLTTYRDEAHNMRKISRQQDDPRAIDSDREQPRTGPDGHRF